jgi:radical SAM superfamily enzyme YgiQ (UPF0313 family)
VRLLLLLPDGRVHRLRLGGFTRSLREAPLTMTLLAALVPPELGVDIRLVDESVDRAPLEERFDVVAISVLTGTSSRAYELADHFRGRGSRVVLGGVHVTLEPDEALRHSDAIVVGFAERSWPRLLRDLTCGRLERVYHDPEVDLRGLPPPRRDLQRRSAYMIPDTVFATRGCRNSCDFCSVPAARFGWHTRPVAEVIDELSSIRSRRVTFNDVSLLEDRDYARELLTAMVPLGKRWGGLATSRVGEDEELLDLLGRSGCRYLLIGFESFSSPTLDAIHKGFNRPADYPELMRRLRRRGIIVQGCFVFGFDHDGPEVFAATVEAVNELKIDIPRYAVYTPYPGTPAFRRLAAEGRLLHRDWRHYDTQHVVFRPARMTPEELDRGFRWAYRETFTLRSMLGRTLGAGWWFPVAFVGNLAYRLYVRRLQEDTERILPAAAAGA